MMKHKTRCITMDDERWDSLSSHPVNRSAAIREAIDLWIMLWERAERNFVSSNYDVCIDDARWDWLGRCRIDRDAAIREAVDLWNLWREHVEADDEMA